MRKINSVEPDTTYLNKKIAKGVEQLNNGEREDFSLFLNDMKHRYGKKE